MDAAGEVFAERGFKGATVREICRKAEANVSAVNYHFGDKESLYVATVRYAHGCAIAHLVAAPPPADCATREQKLHAFVAGFLRGILGAGKPAWFGKLMAREIAEPTVALDHLVADNIRPRMAQMQAIVREYLGPDAPADRVRLCASSVVGQILFYHFARPVLERLFPDHRLDEPAVDGLARHVTAFSAAALECLAERRA